MKDKDTFKALTQILNYYFKYMKMVLSKELLIIEVVFLLFLGLFDFYNYGLNLIFGLPSAKSLVGILGIIIFIYLSISPFLNKQYNLPFVNFIDKEILFLSISILVFCWEQIFFYS